MAKVKDKDLLRKALPPETLSADGKKLLTALQGDSGLACALIGVAAVENALMSLLQRYFIEADESKTIFDVNHALESIIACNQLALCLGLLDRRTYENVKMMARIRNKFAHSHVQIDFDNDDIKALCNKMTFVDPGLESYAPNARTRFVIITYLEWSRILLTAYGAEHRKEMVVKMGQTVIAK